MTPPLVEILRRPAFTFAWDCSCGDPAHGWAFTIVREGDEERPWWIFAPDCVGQPASVTELIEWCDGGSGAVAPDDPECVREPWREILDTLRVMIAAGDIR